MPRYVSFVITGLFAGASTFYACQSNKIGPELPADYVAIRANQSVEVPVGFVIRADTVSVSICPKDASCFAPNSAFVRLSITNGAQSQPVRLFAFISNINRYNHSYEPSDSVSTKFGGQLYKVILRDGRYVPGLNNTIVPEAIVQVSRL